MADVAADVALEHGADDYNAVALRLAHDALAELIAAARYMSSYVANHSALTYSPVACAEANSRLIQALAAATGESHE